MKRQIIVTIDCEDERCGECKYSYGPWINGFGRCSLYGGEYAAHVVADTFDPVMLRLSACLAAEKALRDLAEAGKRMRIEIATRELDNAWDAALAAIEGAGG